MSTFHFFVAYLSLFVARVAIMPRVVSLQTVSSMVSLSLPLSAFRSSSQLNGWPCNEIMLMASCLLLDTIQLSKCQDSGCTNLTPVTLSGRHISWDSDRDVKFKNPPFSGNPCSAAAWNSNVSAKVSLMAHPHPYLPCDYFFLFSKILHSLAFHFSINNVSRCLSGH
jgi:hypothetical protein